MELGGFAETKEDIDGTEEEFNAFNYCLAEDYLSAMLDEDFESLGEVGTSTIEDVMYWLNYDGEIGKDKESIIKSIPKGQLITNNNRTLEEATIENENLYFSEVFIYNGNINPKLFIIVMEKAPRNSYEKSNSLLNLMLSPANSLEEYLEFLKSIFNLIEERYNSKKTKEEKRKFLLKIRPYINGIRISNKYYNKNEIKAFIKKMNYTWKKDMFEE